MKKEEFLQKLSKIDELIKVGQEDLRTFFDKRRILTEDYIKENSKYQVGQNISTYKIYSIHVRKDGEIEHSLENLDGFYFNTYTEEELDKFISHSESEIKIMEELTQEVESLKMKIKQLQEENKYSKVATDFLNDMLSNMDKR